MKKYIVVFVAAILAQQIIQAQGIVYLSNIDQPSAGSVAVGGDSWQATYFFTGNNIGGYTLDSIQLGMANASGSPSDFAAMIYSVVYTVGPLPGTNLGTLAGSTDPLTGIYTYAPVSSLMLLPNTRYFIVLTSRTPIANGAYEWSYAGANSYNPANGWSSQSGGFFISSNGSNWGEGSAIGPQYAIAATPIPEPSVMDLFALGGWFFIRQCRKAKSIQ